MTAYTIVEICTVKKVVSKAIDYDHRYLQCADIVINISGNNVFYKRLIENLTSWTLLNRIKLYLSSNFRGLRHLLIRRFKFDGSQLSNFAVGLNPDFITDSCNSNKLAALASL